MRNAIKSANELLDNNQYQEATKVLIEAGIIEDSSTNAILTRMISRLGIADGYRQIRMPLPANGSEPTMHDKCMAILAARAKITLVEVADFAGCTLKFAGDMKKKFKHEKNKHKKTNISDSSS